MIKRKSESGWDGVPIQTYKNEPGTWLDVTRQNLNAESGANFDLRYFEIAPGGYTSYERHSHEHVVVVAQGNGEVFLDGEWRPVAPGDVVHVGSLQPHQFRNRNKQPFGIFCIVDKQRDRPELLENPPL